MSDKKKEIPKNQRDMSSMQKSTDADIEAGYEIPRQI